MAEFVFATRMHDVSPIARPTLAAIPGLAEAVIQINGLFILAKVNIKCHLISAYQGGRYSAGEVSGISQILTLSPGHHNQLTADGEKVFDEFIGTFGLPSERRVDTTTTSSAVTATTTATIDVQTSPILEQLRSLSAAGICTYESEKI